MLPPESLPTPSGDAPLATAIASPVLDPPGLRSGSAGCRTTVSPDGARQATVLATITAPARRSLATAVASADGRRSR